MIVSGSVLHDRWHLLLTARNRQGQWTLILT